MQLEHRKEVTFQIKGLVFIARNSRWFFRALSGPAWLYALCLAFVAGGSKEFLSYPRVFFFSLFDTFRRNVRFVKLVAKELPNVLMSAFDVDGVKVQKGLNFVGMRC